MIEPIVYNILVVEDSQTDRYLIEVAFQNCEQKCILAFAEDIQQATKQLAENRIHLIILDIHLLEWPG